MDEKNLNEFENAEVIELEDADLGDVAGGGPGGPQLPDVNENCGNTQCCG